MELRPVTLKEAKQFVAKHHRHNIPPVTWRFGVGLVDGDELRGVAMAGQPKARMLMDGVTLEVNRTCTDGTPNANSMLYGAIARAAKALGYKRLVTYTLASEPGTSLRAAGWKQVAYLPTREGWEFERRTGSQRDLWGNEPSPLEPKHRWELSI